MDLPTKFYAPTARIIGSTIKILLLFTNYLFYHLTYQRVLYPPTNVSDIGLNRGKYPSHCQVCNAVRMIHIAAWVHGLMLSHSQAKNPTIHVTYQRV